VAGINKSARRGAICIDSGRVAPQYIVVMNDDSLQDHIKALREAHQAAARDAARTGVTPPAFQNDPAFRELVAQRRDAEETE
jgi:hypothetical protein